MLIVFILSVFTLSVAIWKVLCWMSLCQVPLCWVSLCWMSWRLMSDLGVQQTHLLWKMFSLVVSRFTFRWLFLWLNSSQILYFLKYLQLINYINLNTQKCIMWWDYPEWIYLIVMQSVSIKDKCKVENVLDIWMTPCLNYFKLIEHLEFQQYMT